MSKKNKKMTKKETGQSQPEIIAWEFPEYEKHERSRSWYIIAGVIALALIIYAVWTANYFFALIIMLTGFIMIFLGQEEPLNIKFSLETIGIRLMDKFYDYDKFKSFAIIYQPEHGLKNIYFEYKNGLQPHLSIPLEQTNPITVRNYLLHHLPEDLERKDATFSEGLAKTFKI